LRLHFRLPSGPPCGGPSGFGKKVVGEGECRDTILVRLDVAQVANVADLVPRGTVVFVMGVEVRPGRGAAIGIVAKGVDVHATLGIGIVAGDVPGDLGGSGLRILLECHRAGDLGVATDNADCFDHFE
jgi:hypothetical protein